MKLTVAEKVWKTIRVLNTFTLSELATLTGSSYDNVKTHVGALRATGYIQVAGREKTRGAWRKVYRLAKNTGPRAPVQIVCLYDPNTRQFMPREPRRRVG